MAEEKHILGDETAPTVEASETATAATVADAQTAATAAEAPTAATAAEAPTAATAATVGVDEVTTGQSFSAAAWQPGTVVLDRYRIIKELGRGAFGTVFLALHVEWDKELALKRPKAEALAALGGAQRVVKEAQHWVDLGFHPQLASCYFVRMDGDLPLIFTEYAENGSLAEAIARGDFSKEDKAEKALDVAIQLAWGLSYSHSQGLLHQDVKPANVLLLNGWQTKLTDFGCARQVGEHAGALTPAYASPEQANKEVVTEASDCWSFGLVLMEMLLGERTWRVGAAGAEVLAQAEVNPLLKKVLAEVFAKEPEKRPSMTQLAEKLIKIYEELVGRRYIRRPVEVSPKSVESLTNRALSFVELGKLNEAEELFEEARQLDRNHLLATYNASLLSWRRGHITDEEALRRVEQTCGRLDKKELQQAHLLLAHLHLERDDVESAASKIRQYSETKLLETVKERRTSGHKLAWRTDVHNGAAHCVFITPDGKDVVSGGKDGRLVWLCPERGKVLHSTFAHSGGVQALTLIPSNNWMASNYCPLAYSGGADGVVRAWDVKSRKACGSINIKSGTGVTALAAQGMWLVVGGQELLTLYKVTPQAKGWDFKRIHDFDSTAFGDVGMGNFIVISLAFCAEKSENSFQRKEDKYLVVGCDDPIVRVFETKTGKCVKKLTGHGNYDLNVTSDFGRLATGGRNKVVKVWDVAQEECKTTLEGHRDFVHDLHFVGPNIVSAAKDGTWRLWDQGAGRCLYTSEYHGANVWSLHSCNHPVRVVSASGDGSVRLHNLGHSKAYRAPFEFCRFDTSEDMVIAEAAYADAIEETELAIYEGRINSAYYMLYEARKKQGFTKGEEGMQLWRQLYRHLPKSSLEDIVEVNRIKCTDMVFDLAFGGFGRYILAACFSESGGPRAAMLWDRRTGEKIKEFTLPNSDAIHTVCFTPDGMSALYAGNCGQAFRYSLYTREIEATYGRMQEHNIYSCRVSGDGERLFLGRSIKGNIDVYEMSTGRLIKTLRGHEANISGLAPSYDGSRLLSGCHDSLAIYWDVDRGSHLARTKTRQPIRSVALTHQGDHGFLGCQDGTVIPLDCNSKLFGSGRRVHSDYVHGLVPSPDGRSLFSVSSDRKLKMLSVPQLNQMRAVECHDNYATAVAISDDGAWVATGGFDGTVAWWELDWHLSTKAANLPNSTRRFIEGCEEAQTIEKKLRHCGVFWFDKAGIDKLIGYARDARERKEAQEQRRKEQRQKAAEAQEKANAKRREEERARCLEIAQQVHEENFPVDKVLNALKQLLLFDKNVLTEETRPLWRKMSPFARRGDLLAIGESLPFSTSAKDESANISSIIWPEKGNTIVCGHDDGHLSFWSGEKREFIKREEAHQGAVVSLVNYGRKGQFLSLGRDGKLLLWDSKQVMASPSAQPTLLYEALAGSAELTCCNYSPAEKVIALGRRDGFVELLDIQQRSIITYIPASANAGREHASENAGREPAADCTDQAASAVCFSADGQLLYLGSADGLVKIVECSSRKVIGTRGLQGPILAISSGYLDNYILTPKVLYRFANDGNLRTLNSCHSTYTKFTAWAYSSYEPSIFTLDGQHVGWGGWRKEKKSKAPQAAALSPDGFSLVVANAKKLWSWTLDFSFYHLFDNKNGERLFSSWLSKEAHLRKTLPRTYHHLPGSSQGAAVFRGNKVDELFEELPLYGFGHIKKDKIAEHIEKRKEQPSLKSPYALAEMAAKTRKGMRANDKISLGSFINAECQPKNQHLGIFQASAHTAVIEFKAAFFPPLERASITDLWPMYCQRPPLPAPAAGVTQLPAQRTLAAMATSRSPFDITYFAYSDGTVSCWINDPLRKWRDLSLGSNSPVISISLSKEGLLLAILRQDRSCQVVDCRAEELLSQFTCVSSGQISFIEGTSALAIVSSDGFLRQYKVDNGSLLNELELGAQAHAVALSRNGLFTLAGNRAGKLTLVDNKEAKILQRCSANMSNLESLTVNEQGTKALVNGDQIVSLWSLKSGKKLGEYEGLGKRPTAAAFHPNGRIGLVFFDEKTILSFRSDDFLFELMRADDMVSLPTHIEFCPSNSTAVAACQDGTAYTLALVWKNNYPKAQTSPPQNKPKGPAKARAKDKTKTDSPAVTAEQDPLQFTDEDTETLTFGCGGMVLGVLVFIGLVNYAEFGFWSSAGIGFLVFCVMAAQMSDTTEGPKQLDEQNKEKKE